MSNQYTISTRICIFIANVISICAEFIFLITSEPPKWMTPIRPPEELNLIFDGISQDMINETLDRR